MSATDIQNRLLIAEDWKRIYQTFRNADFQSYDFEALRKSFVDYLRQYYPETFNDYIESSEFIAMLDVIAFGDTSADLQIPKIWFMAPAWMGILLSLLVVMVQLCLGTEPVAAKDEDGH